MVEEIELPFFDYKRQADTIASILERIDVADATSPIAVFLKKYKGEKYIYGVFANTITSAKMIAEKSKGYKHIGNYTNEYDLVWVEDQLFKALYGEDDG